MKEKTPKPEAPPPHVQYGEPKTSRHNRLARFVAFFLLVLFIIEIDVATLYVVTHSNLILDVAAFAMFNLGSITLMAIVYGILKHMEER